MFVLCRFEGAEYSEYFSLEWAVMACVDQRVEYFVYACSQHAVACVVESLDDTSQRPMLIRKQHCIICSLELCKYFTIVAENRDPKEAPNVTTDPIPASGFWGIVGLREKHGEKESVCVETNIKKEIQEEMLGRVLSKMSKMI